MIQTILTAVDRTAQISLHPDRAGVEEHELDAIPHVTERRCHPKGHAMQSLHEYFNLISGLIDLAIACLVLLASRRLTGSIPAIIWILVGFFAVSELGYLNEPSPVFGTHATIAVILDIARLVALVLVAAIAPKLARTIIESLRTARFQADDKRQAMRRPLPRHVAALDVPPDARSH